MKILCLADLHFDIWDAVKVDVTAGITPELVDSVEAVYLAGDISAKSSVRWPAMFRRLRDRGVDMTKLHAFPGNHDYYQERLDREDKLAGYCMEFGVYYAQRAVRTFGDVRVLSCTLWTDYALLGDQEEGMRNAGQVMNDYKYIRLEKTGFGRAQPRHMLDAHKAHLSWLTEELAEHRDQPTIVVTHHAPHPLSIKVAAAGGPGFPDQCYASDLEAVIREYQPSAWLHGHTHHRTDYSVGSCMVRNFSVGYPASVEQSNPRLTNTVPDFSDFIFDTNMLPDYKRATTIKP